MDEGDLSLNLESPNTVVLEMDDAAITIMSKANFIGVKLEGIDFYGIFHLERGLEGQPQVFTFINSGLCGWLLYSITW